MQTLRTDITCFRIPVTVTHHRGEPIGLSLGHRVRIAADYLLDHPRVFDDLAALCRADAMVQS